MSKKIPTRAELYNNADPWNIKKIVQFYTDTDNEKRIQNIFSKYITTPVGKDGHFFAGGLVYEILRIPEERLKTSRHERMRTIRFHEALIERIKLILKEPYLCLYLGLSPKMLKYHIGLFEEFIGAEKNKSKTQRSGRAKTIKYWMRYLVPYLEGFGLGQTKRVNFVYDLFVEFEVPYKEGVKFGTSQIDSEIGPIEQKDRIRKWDEEIMQGYKKILSK